MNTNEIFIPESGFSRETVALFKSISAIQLIAKEHGEGSKLGLISQLGAGTIVEVCGEGFNERTVKVRAHGQCYFVFLQDIKSHGTITRN